MTASDKKKTVILVLLVIVAIGAWQWRMGGFVPAIATTTAPPTKEGKKPASLKSPADAQIRIELIEDISANQVGHRNLFAYRLKPPPQKPPEPPRPVITPLTTIDSAPPPRPPQPPPPPPFKAFRYEGFSVNRGNSKLLASISESGNTYKVSEGDCVMGQYCITRLTETQVEIEDLQLKRKQTFNRAQQ